MPGIENPAAGDGGVSCASDWRHSLDLNCDRRVLQSSANIDGPRFERMVERLHRLGPRPLAELLIEIARGTGQSSFIAARLQAYAGLAPEIVRALRADQFPPRMIEVVK